MKLFFTLMLTMSFSFLNFISAQNQDIWTDVEVNQVAPNRTVDQDYTITEFRALNLDLLALRSTLRNAPMEFTPEGRNTPLTVAFPMPGGEMEDFAIVESPIMEAGLAADFPAIKTFAGYSLTHPSHRIRLDYNDQNFNAILLTTNGTIMITPFAADLEELYVSYWLKNVTGEGHDHTYHGCEVSGANQNDDIQLLDEELTIDESDTRVLEVINLQTYRYAVATTGEYSNGEAGGTVTSVMNNVATITNQLTALYEVEAAIRLIMVDNTDELFFFDALTDPYDNGDLPTMITQNQFEINNTIGSENYDLGHVYGTNSGGLASLASVCSAVNKARAGSAPFGTSSGSNFFLTIAHEIGHQFDATHTFNLCDGDNETPGTGYEAGAGITIMSYSGASNCNQQWIATISDNYFHINSLERIRAFSRDPNSGGSCDVVISVENDSPEASIALDDGFFIPLSTPFKLTGEGTDSDNTDLTYTWEQYDLGQPSSLGSPMGNAPAFRSYLPTATSTRVFPTMERVVNNISHIHEVLPTYTRDLTFRLTVRDNDNEAGTHGYAEVAFGATASAGPFLVTYPNYDTEAWEVGDYTEVTWNVANTDNGAVNCQHVNIDLSLDGGFTYPISLCANTPNDGQEFVNVPAGAVTDMARIRVEAADNIFFDISNENFVIGEPTTAGFTFSATPHNNQLICLPDPLEITIETAGLLDFENEITLSIAAGLPTGAVATFLPETVLPGVQSVLTVDFTNVQEEGVFTLTIQGDAMGVDPEFRFAGFELVYNDFSALAPISPVTSGISLLPTFEWTSIPHADNYELQVSTSPLFEVLAFSIIGDVNSVVSAITLDEGQQYFWRIRPINECSPHDFTTPAAFQTEALICNEATSEDTPLGIPASGLPTITSTINITDSGTIDDLNLNNIQGNHNGFSDIKFVLSHGGTTVEFITDQSCFSAAPFDFGIDEEGLPLPFPCPPTGGIAYQPGTSGSLNDFLGQDANGQWTLSVVVIDDFTQEAGAFSSWTLEYCGSFPAADPFVVTNDTPCVPPEGNRFIRKNHLYIDDNDNAAFELLFTLITVPTNGNLTLSGTALAIGDTFTQSDIDNDNIEYQNINAAVAVDNFTFTVTDGNGGFLGATTFTITIEDNGDCFVNTNDIDAERDILLFPNPAKDEIYVEFKQAINGKMTATMLDVQGRVISTEVFQNVVGTIKFDTAELASGIYFISFQTADNVFTKKMTIE